MKTIKVADFSWTPTGRYVLDGEESGEVFRRTVLVPAIQQGHHLTINLDGVDGYASSFLEEAFNGYLLQKECGECLGDPNDHITIRSVDVALMCEVIEYLRM